MSGVGPGFGEVLQRAQRFAALLDEHVDGQKRGTFVGVDEARTVEVTTDARHRLVELYVESGLLRLGGDVVALRVNEALGNAHAAVSAGNDAAVEMLTAQLGGIAAEVKQLYGVQWPSSAEREDR